MFRCNCDSIMHGYAIAKCSSNITWDRFMYYILMGIRFIIKVLSFFCIIEYVTDNDFFITYPHISAQ